MLHLNDKNIHYIIITAEIKNGEMNKERNSLLEDSLFRRNYRVIKLGGVYNGVEEESFIAFKDIAPVLNNEIRYDAIELMDQFEQECAIVKYLGDESPTKICNDGSEIPMGLVKYNGNNQNRSYFYEGNTFAFTESRRYYKPSKKTDLKVGMVVEYLNDNKIWVEKKIVNLEKEYDNMYKLLIKYDRLRCPS